MENPLKLRKPSNKPLLMLISVAEQLLFSFPVSSDLIKKYETMRTKVFRDLKIKNTPLPIVAVIDHEISSQHSKKKNSESFKVLESEMISIISQSQDISEKFCNELEFCDIIFGNIFNNLAKIFEFDEKLEVKVYEKIGKNEEISKEYSENEIEEEIEKNKMKSKEKYERFKEIKERIKEREKKITSLIKSIEKKVQIESDKIKRHNKEKEEQIVKNEKYYVEMIENLKKNIDEMSIEKQDQEKIYTNRIDELLIQINEIQENKGLMQEKIANIPDKKAENLAEIIRLKEISTELELQLHNKTIELAKLAEKCKNLTDKNKEHKKKLIESATHSENLLFQIEELKSELECLRNSFENQVRDLKTNFSQHEYELQQNNEQMIYSIQNMHSRDLNSIKSANEKELSSLKNLFENEINMLKQTNTNLKNQIVSNDETSQKVIKSLQFEILKEKIGKKDDLSTENTKEQQNIGKIEKRFEECLTCIEYISSLVAPIYRAYAHLQKDWNYEYYSQNTMKKIAFDYKDTVIFVEFCVFYLEKTLRDKQWLINKLSEACEENKLSKTTSLGNIISPSNTREKYFIKQIWNDIKDTTEALKNFEKSRENLILHFSPFK